MSNVPFWENIYSQANAASTFGEAAGELVQLASLLPASADVLDLGCGEGRNALYLAGRGFRVTAIDISVSGIGKLKQTARARGLSMKAEVHDMREYAFECSYDLVVAHGSLHLIGREYWTPLMHRIKAHTRDGGHNVVVVFTDAIPPSRRLKGFSCGTVP